MKSRQINGDIENKPIGNMDDKVEPQKKVPKTIDDSSYVFLNDCKNVLISNCDNDITKKNTAFIQEINSSQKIAIRSIVLTTRIAVVLTKGLPT